MARGVTYNVGKKTYHVDKAKIGKKSFSQLKKELPHFPDEILRELSTPDSKIEEKEVEEKPTKKKATKK